MAPTGSPEAVPTISATDGRTDRTTGRRADHTRRMSMGKIRLLLLPLAVWGAIAGPPRPVAAEEAPRGATIEERLDALDQRQRVLERNRELDLEAAQEKGKS